MKYLCEMCKDDGRWKKKETSKEYDDLDSEYWDCVE